jgi:predicted TIM-barrel fold metal-dependent hydrolase
MIKVKDGHTHSGGLNYSIYIGNESIIEDYVREADKLKNNSINLEETLTFAQPEPYKWLTNYGYNLPVIDFSIKNNEIGEKCSSYDNILFAVFVDARDYNASKEIQRCVKKYNTRAVKIHLGVHLVNPEILEKYEVIKSAREYNLPIIIHYHEKYVNKLREVISKNKDINFIIPHFGYFGSKIVKIVESEKNAFFDSSAYTHRSVKYEIIEKYFSDLITDRSGVSKNQKLHPSLKDFVNINREEACLREIIEGKLSWEFIEMGGAEIDYEKIIETMVKVVGSNKIIFGSDRGWEPIKRQIRFINESNISEEDKKNIFYKNFDKIFK